MDQKTEEDIRKHVGHYYRNRGEIQKIEQTTSRGRHFMVTFVTGLTIELIRYRDGYAHKDGFFRPSTDADKEKKARRRLATKMMRAREKENGYLFNPYAE